MRRLTTRIFSGYFGTYSLDITARMSTATTARTASASAAHAQTADVDIGTVKGELR